MFEAPQSPYLVPYDGSFSVAKASTTPLTDGKPHKGKHRRQRTENLNKLQRVLAAGDKHSVLLVFQAMDAAGKDSTIRSVLQGVDPSGCQVFSFKKPSSLELDHDFLWRTTCRLPERGRIGIFNRSYYEEVLVVRVHPEILRNQKIPDDLVDPDTIWQQRYRSITDLEDHLHRNGTRVIKFFLHLSEEEQCKRFLARIDDPGKNWKFSAADIEERKFWPQYMQAYQACLNATSTVSAPWFVVPADDKKNARLLISSIILDTYKSLEMSYPVTDAQRRAELLLVREQLLAQE